MQVHGEEKHDMNTCEACQVSLTQADLDRGRCPACGRSLAAVPAKPGESSRTADKTWKMAQSAGPSSQKSDNEKEPGIIDRSAQTLQAGTIEIPDSQSDTAGGNEARGAATVGVPEPPSVPPGGESKGRIEATIALGATAAFAPARR